MKVQDLLDKIAVVSSQVLRYGIQSLTSLTRPTAPGPGQVIYEQDTSKLMIWNGVAWVQTPLLFSPPACRIYHNTTQSCADQVETLVLFNSERWDTDSMHSTVSNTSRVTFNTAGLYALTFACSLAALTTYFQIYTFFKLNGATSLGYFTQAPSTANVAPSFFNTTVYKFSAGDYIEVFIYQDNTANVPVNLSSGGNYTPELTATWIGTGV